MPGGGHTNASPTVVNFQEELYLLIKGLTSNHILAMARSTDANSWSEWAELPGARSTDADVAAVSANSGWIPRGNQVASRRRRVAALRSAVRLAGTSTVPG